MMTPEERAAYAREQRERCAPLECTGALNCWVVVGGKAALNGNSLAKAARCGACGGMVRDSEWKPPRELALSDKARAEARAHNRGV